MSLCGPRHFVCLAFLAFPACSGIKADADSLEENEHPEKPILVGDLPFLRAHWWKLLVWYNFSHPIRS